MQGTDSSQSRAKVTADKSDNMVSSICNNMTRRSSRASCNFNFSGNLDQTLVFAEHHHFLFKSETLSLGHFIVALIMEYRY